MARVNENYLKLQAGYLFPEISKRVQAYTTKNPNQSIIRLGIGDVTLPLPSVVIKAMHAAVDEMGESGSFRGYGPEQGYAFLRETISTVEYGSRGVTVSKDEIFVSDGSKCDSGNIQEIFSPEARIAVTDPVYPVYVDTNVMAGRSGSMKPEGHYKGMSYLPSHAENSFLPPFPEHDVDLVYLCSPNNPTGTVFSREVLTDWVQYALTHKVILLFDAAYEAFIQDPNIPHSIYEIPDARKVAIEFRSFSKSAGFTGTRCAYTVVPKECMAECSNGEKVSLHSLWNRRHATKFNGVSYVIQRGAEAALSSEGQKEIQERISYYMENAQWMLSTLRENGVSVYGGENAPYIWFRVPKGQTSWDTFDTWLEKAGIVGTPGSGFGPAGEGYFRLSAFGSKENVQEAMERFKKLRV